MQLLLVLPLLYSSKVLRQQLPLAVQYKSQRHFAAASGFSEAAAATPWGAPGARPSAAVVGKQQLQQQHQKQQRGAISAPAKEGATTQGCSVAPAVCRRESCEPPRPARLLSLGLPLFLPLLVVKVRRVQLYVAVARACHTPV